MCFLKCACQGITFLVCPFLYLFTYCRLCNVKSNTESRIYAFARCVRCTHASRVGVILAASPFAVLLMDQEQKAWR